MKILMTGATGLIGRQLSLRLIELGHSLVVITTRSEKNFRESFTYPCEYLHWDNINKVPQVDAVFHLAGENIADGRWTKKKKNSILNSRVEPTESLIQALRINNRWPKTFISTSAIGYYGDRGKELLDEDAKAGNGFLADVCKAWEGTAKLVGNHCRLVILRLGIVLDAKDGFLKKLEPLFASNLGGKVGDGQQWMSWIHVEDLVNLYIHALDNDEVSGIYNAVAPNPVTNSHFTKVFAEQLHVLSILPAPTFALKLILGEMSQLALASQNVFAEKIQSTGFQFHFQHIESALQDIYS